MSELLLARHSIGTIIPPPDLTYGLATYYPFNGNANDESPNGNDGIVTGAQLTTGVQGQSNSAYEFDGINDKIEGSNVNRGENINDSLIISVWIYMDEIIGRNFVCGQAKNNANAGNFIQVDDTDGGRTLYVVYDNFQDGHNAYKVVGPVPILGQWNHLYMQTDGGAGSTLEGYLNNQLVGTDTLTNQASNANPQDFNVGWDERNNNRFFKGKIDQVRLYGKRGIDNHLRNYLYNNKL